MDLYTDGGNIHLGNSRRFTSLTMYNMHIFYLAPLMFSRSNHFLISGLYAGNTKIKGQPHWVVLLDLRWPSERGAPHDCFLPCMIIVSFHTCGIRWSICFLQSRRGSQGWQFLFLSRGAWLLFPSMHVASCDRFVFFKARRDRRRG